MFSDFRGRPNEAFKILQRQKKLKIIADGNYIVVFTKAVFGFAYRLVKIVKQISHPFLFEDFLQINSLSLYRFSRQELYFRYRMRLGNFYLLTESLLFTPHSMSSCHSIACLLYRLLFIKIQSSHTRFIIIIIIFYVTTTHQKQKRELFNCSYYYKLRQMFWFL